MHDGNRTAAGRMAVGWTVVAAAAALATLAAPLPAQDSGSTGGQLGEIMLFGEEELMVQAATKTEVPLSKVPGSVTVITAEQIRESGARTIPEILRSVAGVNVRWNPMVQTVDIRSFGQNPFTSRVLFLIDGVAYNDWNKGGFPQHPGFDFFDLQNVKRIELVRGPGSALYGENAYWGVINIVTLGGADLQGGKVEAYGGDLETRSLSAMYGKRLGEGHFLVSAKALNSQFPTRFWAEESDAEVESSTVYLKGGYKGVEVSYFRYDDKVDGFREEVPIPGFPPGAFQSIAEIEQSVDILALKLNHDWGSGVSFGGDVSYARRDGSHCAACHAVGEEAEFSDTHEDHGFQLVGDFRLRLQMIPSHDLLVGVEAREIDAGDHVDELLPETPGGPEIVSSYTKLAAYVQDQISLADDRFRLTLGARYDDSTDLFDSEVSPRVAAVYSATDALVVRGGWSRAFRFPNFSELYQSSWFFTFDADPPGIPSFPLAVFLPNPELQPEKIDTFDLGAEARLSAATSLRVDLFHSTVDDFVVMTFPALNPMGLLGVRFENQPDEATITGGEIELRWKAGGTVSGFVNYSREETDQRDSFRDSTGNLFEFVYAPENKVNVSAFFGPWAGFRASLEVSWRDDTVAPAIWGEVLTGVFAPVPLDDYTLLNARLSYELPWRARGSALAPRVSVHGRNLLDEEATETLTGADVRLVGRQLYGSFEIGF